jgi:hypothetical protein
LSLGSAAAGAAPERVFGQFVTTNFFTVLGARAAAGRLFSPADSEQPGASPIVVLSDAFWRRRFGADPTVLTRTISLNGRSVDVVGVAPEGFHGTGVLAADVWLPLSMVAAVGSEGEGVFANRAGGWLVMGGRLRPASRPHRLRRRWKRSARTWTARIPTRRERVAFSCCPRRPCQATAPSSPVSSCC